MKIVRHEDWELYRKAFAAAMTVFEVSKSFPKAETFSLTDQMRRSSRSVAANLAEAWRKRRYEAAFIAKLSDAETEAAETQTWIAFAQRCEYLPSDRAAGLQDEYEQIIRMTVSMIVNAKQWIL
jgi:four helix bundle protein